MTKRMLLIASLSGAIAVALSFAPYAATPESNRIPATPNIILVFFDDVGYADFGITGSSTPTPTIDALANNGVQFTQFYDASPVCSASRAA